MPEQTKPTGACERLTSNVHPEGRHPRAPPEPGTGRLKPPPLLRERHRYGLQFPARLCPDKAYKLERAAVSDVSKSVFSCSLPGPQFPSLSFHHIFLAFSLPPPVRQSFAPLPPSPTGESLRGSHSGPRSGKSLRREGSASATRRESRTRARLRLRRAGRAAAPLRPGHAPLLGAARGRWRPLWC